MKFRHHLEIITNERCGSPNTWFLEPQRHREVGVFYGFAEETYICVARTSPICDLSNISQGNDQAKFPEADRLPSE